ncbi:MAG TPA: zinc ribbon domain-containing protein [Anaerolineaceae bacterium]|nr:zinc ribbon domain-containing protein [Anaerolineaceae bacterium]
MKPVWKWVIGIVIGLIVVAALVGGAILLRNYLLFRHVAVQVQKLQPGQQMPPFGNRNCRVPGFGMREYGIPGFGMRRFGGRGFGMMGWGLMPFGGILGGLFSLGLLALLVLGIVWLVRSLRTPKQVVEMHPCSNCGEPVQTDWRYCPSCGKKQRH